MLMMRNVYGIVVALALIISCKKKDADPDPPAGLQFVKAENLEELNVMALPTTFIFNTDGKLVFNEMGFRKWDDKENLKLILNIIKSK